MLYWNGECVSMLCNVLQHTNTPNTELIISKQDINPLYHFYHCIDSF